MACGRRATPTTSGLDSDVTRASFTSVTQSGAGHARAPAHPIDPRQPATSTCGGPRARGSARSRGPARRRAGGRSPSPRRGSPSGRPRSRPRPRSAGRRARWRAHQRELALGPLPEEAARRRWRPHPRRLSPDCGRRALSRWPQQQDRGWRPHSGASRRRLHNVTQRRWRRPRLVPRPRHRLDAINVNGGAIAFGHPLGAAAVRLVLTLTLEFCRRRRQARGCRPVRGGGRLGDAHPRAGDRQRPAGRRRSRAVSGSAPAPQRSSSTTSASTVGAP